jgi:uncharacterized protein (DUF362 family)/Pyruvate/2-oxoacid:ferredoxin oxidoreductase delta subunit
MPPKVALVGCESYDQGLVDSAVARALSLLGGMEGFVGAGDRVLIKVNLLSASPPEKAVTTHPSIVKAAVKAVQAAGGVPVIADSPGGPYTKGMLERAYRSSGMTGVAEETGALLNFDTGSMQVSNPGGVLVKRLDLLSVLAEADVVISLPKMKTHTLTKFTGATKVLFGLVPGLTKPAYHLKFRDVDDFCDMLLDILGHVRPVLSIMDGVIGMEGDGPGAHGIPTDSGVILASGDSISLDVVASTVMGFEPSDTPVIRRAIARGLISGRICDIQLVGDDLAGFCRAYKKPSTSGGLFQKAFSSHLMRNIFLNNLAAYPSANEMCVGCGICAQNCPAKAITMAGRARMDLGKCIRCYCCHELCPNRAIDLKKGFFSRVLTK